MGSYTDPGAGTCGEYSQNAKHHELCLFCSFIRENNDTKILWQDQVCLIIKDKQPKAPHHYLVISKRHISGAWALRPCVIEGEIVGNEGNPRADSNMLYHMATLGKNFMEASLKKKVDSTYRASVHSRDQVTQPHFHIHLTHGDIKIKRYQGSLTPVDDVVSRLAQDFNSQKMQLLSKLYYIDLFLGGK